MMSTFTTQWSGTQFQHWERQVSQPSMLDSLLRAPVSRLGQSIIYPKASCACGGGCPACQAKSSDLKVSQPNDWAEIEADQIANRIMRMSVHEPETSAVSDVPPNLHRKCATCNDDKVALHRKALPSYEGTPSQVPEHVQHATGSGGRSLDRETRSFFEPRFGYDLSGVRLHIGGTAAESAHAVGAKAYTLGNNIVFGNGEYKPESETGRHLLAHELVHVARQSK